MRVSYRLIPFLLVLAMGSPTMQSQDAPGSAELTRLLHQFLKAASMNDAAVFDSFFADDVIYTRSSGATITKADIMRGLRGQGSESQRPAERASQTYDADNITIHQHGDVAVVAFRLIALPVSGGAPAYYRNTGTFLKRDGKWQAIAWQSTKTPADAAGAAAR
ncbi:MAG: nuclear transport factor 2 family protein [Acidobacteria bacterium]|nr:nuclear transport factor 2 family protein [Acidobacteriota bacterium]